MKLKTVIKIFRAICMAPLYKFYHSKVSITTYIRKGTIPKDSIIGKYCWINKNVGLNKVKIGNYCSIASQVLIGGMEHPVDKYSTSTLLNESSLFKSKTTVIGNNVWIGTQCIIRQGIHIGNGAVIGANSLVNKDVPPYAIVFGTPARVVRIRLQEEEISAIEESHFWDYPPEEAINILNTIYNKQSQKNDRNHL